MSFQPYTWLQSKLKAALFFLALRRLSAVFMQSLFIYIHLFKFIVFPMLSIMILHCKLGCVCLKLFSCEKKKKQFICMRIYATKIKHDVLRHRMRVRLRLRVRNVSLMRVVSVTLCLFLSPTGGGLPLIHSYLPILVGYFELSQPLLKLTAYLKIGNTKEMFD